MRILLSMTRSWPLKACLLNNCLGFPFVGMTLLTSVPRAVCARFGAVAIAAIIVLLAASCQKPELAGEGLLPEFEHDNLFQSDTFTIVAETELWDSIDATAGDNIYLLGDFNDPFFGRTSAGFYTQFTYSSVPSFPTGSVVDSVVMTLKYAGIYGNADKLTGTQKVKVFELSEKLTDSKTYFTTDQHTYHPQELGSKTFWPDLSHDVVLDGNYYSPHLRIKLNNDFGQRLLNINAYGSEATFKENFWGFAVMPDNSGVPVDQGGIAYFKLSDAVSGVTLYLHTSTDTLSFSYPIKTTCVSHSWFSHEYVSDLLAHIGNPDLGRHKLFVQGTAGTRVKIRFPYLSQMAKDGPIAISKAQLICPVEEFSDARYTASPGLFLQRYIMRVSSSGNADSLSLALLTDMTDNQVGGLANFNEEHRQYVLDLPLFAQRVVNGDFGADTAIYITTSGYIQAAYRSVLVGPGDPVRPMKLRILYTKLEP